MTKLKTLKDLEGFSPSIIHGQAFLETDKDQEWTGNAILRDKLKAEAIRWIRDLREGGFTQVNEKFMKDKGRKEWMRVFRVSHILWIKHFFNITEDNLK